jgi:hypothetical protein
MLISLEALRKPYEHPGRHHHHYRFCLMLPGPPEGKHSALWLYTSILRWFQKHLEWGSRVFRMLWYWTTWIVTYWGSWDLYTGLWGTSSAAEISAAGCGRPCAIFSQQQFSGSDNYNVLRLCHLFLFQSQAVLHHNMTSIIWACLSICFQMVNLATDSTSA